MTGEIKRNWDAYDIEQRLPSIRSGSFATNGTTVRFVVQFDVSKRWAALYADHKGRLAFISHPANGNTTLTVLSGEFNNTSIASGAVYLNVGNWTRCHVLWFSSDIDSIPIVTT